MYTELLKHWRKYSPTDRPAGWGTPFAWRAFPSSLLWMVMCDTCIVSCPLPLFLHLNRFLASSPEGRASAQTENLKVHWRPFSPGSGVTLCGLECLEESSFVGSSSLLRERRRGRRASFNKKRTHLGKDRWFLLGSFQEFLTNAISRAFCSPLNTSLGFHFQRAAAELWFLWQGVLEHQLHRYKEGQPVQRDCNPHEVDYIQVQQERSRDPSREHRVTLIFDEPW